jgi:hypothetical protein
MNRTRHYLLKDVAAALGVRPYRIAYAISVGLVPEPVTRIANKRIFSERDVRRLAAHFGVESYGNDGLEPDVATTATDDDV